MCCGSNQDVKHLKHLAKLATLVNDVGIVLKALPRRARRVPRHLGGGALSYLAFTP